MEAIRKWMLEAFFVRMDGIGCDKLNFRWEEIPSWKEFLCRKFRKYLKISNLSKFPNLAHYFGNSRLIEIWSCWPFWEPLPHPLTYHLHRSNKPGLPKLRFIEAIWFCEAKWDLREFFEGSKIKEYNSIPIHFSQSYNSILSSTKFKELNYVHTY